MGRRTAGNRQPAAASRRWAAGEKGNDGRRGWAVGRRTADNRQPAASSRLTGRRWAAGGCAGGKGNNGRSRHGGWAMGAMGRRTGNQRPPAASRRTGTCLATGGCAGTESDGCPRSMGGNELDGRAGGKRKGRRRHP
jgi:hypothetical protein